MSARRVENRYSNNEYTKCKSAPSKLGGSTYLATTLTGTANANVLNTSAVEAELVNHKFNKEDWLVQPPALEMERLEHIRFDVYEAGRADEHRDTRNIALAAGILSRLQGVEHTPHERPHPLPNPRNLAIVVRYSDGVAEEEEGIYLPEPLPKTRRERR